MDERYKRGKIYTVRCRYDDTLIYVGSTIEILSKRMGKHRRTTITRATSLYNIVCGDWDKWYIELYENYPCNNKQELERREGQVIREIGTINNNIAGRTPKERYQDNRDKILEEKKKYRIKNLQKITDYNKEYRKENRDKLIEYSKQYYKNNNFKFKCNICGCEVTKYGLKNHLLSKKCMNYNINN